jgi:hypothetical protein
MGRDFIMSAFDNPLGQHVEVKEYLETLKRLAEVLKHIDNEIIDIKKRLDRLEAKKS